MSRNETTENRLFANKAEFENEILMLYRLLEKDLMKAMPYVHFSQGNLNAYSIVFYKSILSSSAQIEILMKQFLQKRNLVSNSKNNIISFRKILGKFCEFNDIHTFE